MYDDLRKQWPSVQEQLAASRMEVTMLKQLNCELQQGKNNKFLVGSWQNI